MKFDLVSEFSPTGDQPQAIEKLSEGIKENKKFQTLKGVTGSGKTFTMANIIEKVQKPTIVIAHNKTLAYQLYSEFKEFFPNNAVEYFVSYYDFYQPEAYVARTDTYIAKDASINDEIDRMRHSATSSLFEREDIIIVASVSCIYGLGDPEEYEGLMVSLREGMEISMEEVVEKLIGIQYTRNDLDFQRSTFRIKGDNIEIIPANASEKSLRIEFFGDEIDRITEVEYLTGKPLHYLSHVTIFPASHYATDRDKIKRAIETIREELVDRLEELKSQNKLVEAQRLEQRTLYDIEMLEEIGFVSGIENYSRHISQRKPGSRPYTLLDYFPEDYIMFIDESHVTVPQIGGMYEGDRSRKQNLVDYGFRLPSALDNRPLKFNEFESLLNEVIFVSATPGPYEKDHSSEIVEQIIRPTGLLDPKLEVRPTKNQIDDLMDEIDKTIEAGYRVLITTLTKKMAEDLTDYLSEAGVKVTYLHSEVKTIERMEIIRDLRKGKYDVLVGINLLREGLDIPEVSLIAIMDADKQGFLRSETSLIQTIGRAARNVNGRVIMYGDEITKAMRMAIDETNRRRSIQEKYNEENNIEPKSIVKEIRDVTGISKVIEEDYNYEGEKEEFTLEDIQSLLTSMNEEMLKAAELLDFERAANIRDKIRELKNEFGL